MALAPGELDVRVLGRGPRMLLVHGSIIGTQTWARQGDLAERYTLMLASRPGFGASPPLQRGDFEAEAPLFAALMQREGHGGSQAGADTGIDRDTDDAVHLVGHSYGGVIALYAAALSPHAVRSLTVSEPGCIALAAHDPLVAAQLANGKLLYERAGDLSPLDFLRAFRGGVGSARVTPDRLEGELLQGVRLLMRERPPWEAEPPLQVLAEAPFPKLVISGGHSPVFETTCDALAERLGAERATVAGAGHSIPATGAPYNDLLGAFLARSETGH